MATAAPSFKQLLFAAIQEHVAQQTPFSMTWDCLYCGGSHTGNLFKKVRSVAEVAGESNHIILTRENGQPFAIVSISKNKKPNTDIANRYREQNIIYIQICPPADKDKSVAVA